MPPAADVSRGRRPTVVALVAAVGALLVDLLVWGGSVSARIEPAPSPLLMIAVLLVLYAPLAFGARLPVIAFAAIWVASLAGLPLPRFEALAGPMVALFLVARFSTGWVTFIAVLAALVPAAINAWNNALQNQPDRWMADLAQPDFWAFLATWLLVFALPVLLGRVLHALARRTQEHDVELARAAADAVAAERARITQELHDIVAHSLSAIVLQAAGARAVHTRNDGGLPEVADALGAIEAAGGQAMRELHRLLGLLRGSRAPQEASHQPLYHAFADIGQLVETTRSAGLDVSVTAQGRGQPLDPSVEHAAYRMIQEGLTNAMKHAGVGARVAIRLGWTAGAVSISIRTYDGADKPVQVASGHGLVNLAERIHLVGGTFEAMPLPDGFLMSARFRC